MEKSKIREFIDENSLDFKEGSRNTDVTTVIGYSQFLGISRNDLENELIAEINEDSFIGEEIARLWNYCSTNNYSAFWGTKQAKKQYIFD